jgi:2-succinyl-5-enolpyruvyl-6-hydroxy-3-cyclohexene-1-carboxylate synthase
LHPAVVLRFGAAPTSKPLLSLLKESSGAAQILVDESGALGDDTARGGWAISCDPELLVRALSAAAVHRPASSFAARVQAL